MLPPAPLYKFSSAADALSILESGVIWTKSPLDFNDPFEVLPAFDEERKNVAITSRKEFYKKVGLSGGGQLVAGGNEEVIPVEQWVDLAKNYHDPFFEVIAKTYRVLCFGEDPTPTLLWSHYAESHKGIALGFDLSKGAFPLGQRTEGLAVEYADDRTSLKLPLEYYRFRGLEDLEPAPSGFTTTMGGLYISKTEQNAIYLDCLMKLLGTKDSNWAYEKERRFIYNLALSYRDGLESSGEHHAARFDPGAVTEVIFGYRCTPAEIRDTWQILEKNYPNAKLGYVDLHPHKYEVRVHYSDIVHVIATHSERMNNFRARIKSQE